MVEGFGIVLVEYGCGEYVGDESCWFFYGFFVDVDLVVGGCGFGVQGDLCFIYWLFVSLQYGLVWWILCQDFCCVVEEGGLYFY